MLSIALDIHTLEAPIVNYVLEDNGTEYLFYQNYYFEFAFNYKPNQILVPTIQFSREKILNALIKNCTY